MAFCFCRFQHLEFGFEQSELILYQNMILRESGQLKLALTKLEENASQIIDQVTYLETRGLFRLSSFTVRN